VDITVTDSNRALSRIGVSRAFRPGSRFRLVVPVAAAIAAATTGYLAFAGNSTPAAKYGQRPSWLPTAKIPVGRLVTASAARPWLAVEGDTVAVHLAHGRVHAMTVGPTVPEEGQFPVPETTPCTFAVTFTAASGTVPINPKAFTIADELGHIHRTTVTRIGGGKPPAQVLPGQTIALVVRDVLPTGDGALRWTPQGTTPVVSWDFDVEID
jgi:hypothetical protein